MDNTTLLKSRFEDLAAQADKRFSYTFSGFLSLPEQDLFLKMKNAFPVPAFLYGPSEDSERKIAVFGSYEELGYEPDYPVKVLEIAPVSDRFSETLSHRDYLGAVLNTGIDRSLTGDIVIHEKRAWLFCLDSIAAFIKETLTHIRHTDVTVREADSDIPELKPSFEEVRLNVPSERLDAVVAAFIKESRTKASLLFTRELVFVNSQVVTNLSAHLKEGDVLNVRGYGKAIYEGIDGTSRKGRLYVVLKKYI